MEETLDAAWNIPNFTDRSSILTSNYGLFKARFYKTRVLTLPGTPSSPWGKLYSPHTPWDDAPCHRFRVSAASPGWGGYGAGAGKQPYRAQGYDVSCPTTTPTELR